MDGSAIHANKDSISNRGPCGALCAAIKADLDAFSDSKHGYSDALGAEQTQERSRAQRDDARGAQTWYLIGALRSQTLEGVRQLCLIDDGVGRHVATRRRRVSCTNRAVRKYLRAPADLGGLHWRGFLGMTVYSTYQLQLSPLWSR